MFEQKKKEEGFKRSEGLFRIKERNPQQKREELTGYERLDKEQEGPGELVRMENSYGNIAFGGGSDGKMTILVSEKRRHDQPSLSNREKRIQESRQIQKPVSGGRVFTNNGNRESGAVAFQYDRNMSARNMLGRMETYMIQHEQQTLRQMVPALEIQRDKKLLSSLEERIRTLKFQKEDEKAASLEKEKDHLMRDLQEREQMERKLRKKLIDGMEQLQKEIFSEKKDEMLRKFVETAVKNQEEVDSDHGEEEEKEGDPVEEDEEEELKKI